MVLDDVQVKRQLIKGKIKCDKENAVAGNAEKHLFRNERSEDVVRRRTNVVGGLGHFAVVREEE